MLVELDGTRKVGIEINEAARTVARANGIEAPPTLAEVADESVDVVISNHALEHVLSPYQELQGLFRVLRPGGRAVIWVPIDDWRSRVNQGTELSHHLYAWTPPLFRNLLGEAGFEVERCRVVTHAWSLRFAPLEGCLPAVLYRALCFALAVVRRRRQLEAVARRPT